MKKILIIGLSVLLFLGCKNQKGSENEYLINGYITGYFEGKVVLGKYQNNKMIPIDSVFMTKSKFKFKKVKVENPELYYLIVDDGKIVIEFFMDQAHIQINADYNNEGVIEVQGSKAHNEYVAFLENNVVFENKQRDIYAQKDLAMSNNDMIMLAELDSLYSATFQEQLNFIHTYVLGNKKSFVSAFIASRSLADFLTIDELEKISGNYTDSIKTSVYFKELTDKIEVKKRTQVGMQAPDFSLPDSTETNISLSSLQGKYVLLFFSASWHGISRSKNPDLIKIYRTYNKKGFEIYQASLERDIKQWKNVIETDKINWIVVSDMKGLESNLIELYGIRSLPKLFLLDKKGVILSKDFEIDELDLLLKEILN